MHTHVLTLLSNFCSPTAVALLIPCSYLALRVFPAAISCSSFFYFTFTRNFNFSFHFFFSLLVFYFCHASSHLFLFLAHMLCSFGIVCTFTTNFRLFTRRPALFLCCLRYVLCFHAFKLTSALRCDLCTTMTFFLEKVVHTLRHIHSSHCYWPLSARNCHQACVYYSARLKVSFISCIPKILLPFRCVFFYVFFTQFTVSFLVALCHLLFNLSYIICVFVATQCIFIIVIAGFSPPQSARK